MADDQFDPGAATPVSAKSTKQEIFSAYKELLGEFKKKADDSRGKKETKQVFEQEVVQKVAGYSVETILEAISNLDGTVRRSLRELGEQLIDESQKLRELQEAIRIEKENLEKIKKINVAIDTLENLIEAQKFEKEEFEKAMAQQEEEFKRSMQAKKDLWKREQEEYEYNLSQRRKKEENEYAEKRALQESALAQREKTMADAEKELLELRERSHRFQSEIDEAVRKAREEATAEIQKEEYIKADLLREKHEGERKIASLTIDTLKERVASLEAEMATLKQQVVSATQEVKDVAVKVIEGRSRFEENQRMAKMLDPKMRGEGKGE